jgi:nucleoside-triphosphatase
MSKIKNILITGRPGIGKTTLIKKIAQNLPGKIGGFYTSEIRENDQRVGFSIIDFYGNKGILAHVKIKSPVKVSKYGINFVDLENIGVAAIRRAQKEADFILVDEIGKMELASSKFKSAILSALNCPKICIATIMQKDNYLTRRIKNRSDVKLFEITLENRDSLANEIIKLSKTIAEKK